MKRLHSKPRFRGALRFGTVFFFLISGFAIHFGYADEKPIKTDSKHLEKNDKIHVTADRLISDNNAGYAEFIGNVRATQENSVITSDRLKIFYNRNRSNKETFSVGEESIHKMVATGNVNIKFDDRVAEAQEAVYNTETRILVLTGQNSKIISGNDSISGEKITFYRADGRINVESGNKKRVEAIFFSGEKGLK